MKVSFSSSKEIPGCYFENKPENLSRVWVEEARVYGTLCWGPYCWGKNTAAGLEESFVQGGFCPCSSPCLTFPVRNAVHTGCLRFMGGGG